MTLLVGTFPVGVFLFSLARFVLREGNALMTSPDVPVGEIKNIEWQGLTDLAYV